MAQVFLSYARDARAEAAALTDELAAQGHQLFRLDVTQPGTDIFRTLRQGIAAADYVVVLLTPNYWRGETIATELSVALASEETAGRPHVIPILVDPDASIPSLLGQRTVLRATGLGPGGLGELLRPLLQGAAELEQTPEPTYAIGLAQARIIRDEPDQGPYEPGWAGKLGDLAEAISAGKLAVFVGAGVSRSSGLPPWEVLVDRVLGVALGRPRRVRPDLTPTELAQLLRLSSKQSELILAEHARRELGPDFIPTIREELYRTGGCGGELVAALSRLLATGCSPGVVNYNFDDCLETQMAVDGTPFHVVTATGQREGAKGLPIFHVHGYLPRDGQPSATIVFAESEYNDETLDPYRWSAITQLSYLTEYSVLFVGVSINDPTLRRLLDVVRRRGSPSGGRHFAIRRKTDPQALREFPVRPMMTAENADAAAKAVDLLVEGDLNGLGVQVLWVDGHQETPDVLRAAAEMRGA